MGSKAYSNKATIAGLAPMPNSGIIKPKSAMLGMVCKTPAIPKIMPENCFLAGDQDTQRQTDQYCNEQRNKGKPDMLQGLRQQLIALLPHKIP